MGFWPFGRKGEGVEIATRIVSAAPRDGVVVRGKLTLHFASRESKTTADVIADQVASLVEAIVREAPDKSHVVGHEADVLGELEARLPSNMPATRTIEIAALHAVGDFGPRPSGEFAGLTPSRPSSPGMAAPSRPSAPGSSGARPMGSDPAKPPTPSQAGRATPPSGRTSLDDELDFSFDAIALDTTRRPLGSSAGSNADGADELHPKSSRALELDRPASDPAPRPSKPAASSSGAWPPVPPSRPSPKDLFLDLDDPPHETPNPRKPSGSGAATPRVLPDLDDVLGLEERPSQRLASAKDERPSQRFAAREERPSQRLASAKDERPSQRLASAKDERPSQRFPSVEEPPPQRPARDEPRPGRIGTSPQPRGRGAEARPAAQPSPPARNARGSRGGASGGTLEVGSPPEVIGAAIAKTLADGACRLLLGALRAHDLIGVRGQSIDDCDQDVLTSFAPAADAPLGGFEARHGQEIARWKGSFGVEAVERIRAETAVCVTYLAYATMLEADVPQNITIEVLQAACAAAFSGGRSPFGAIGRYMSPTEPSLAEELGAQLAHALGASFDIAAMGYALGPVMTSIEGELVASAQVVKEASGL